MVTTSRHFLRHGLFSESGYQKKTSELQRCTDDPLTKLRDVVLIGASDLLDQTMGTQSFEDTGDLSCVFTRQESLQMTILEATDVEFTANDGLKDRTVVAVEEVKATVSALPVVSPPGDLLQVLDPGARIVQGGEKLQVTTVRRPHQVLQIGQAVDRFLDLSVLHLPTAVSVFHPAVVLKRGHVVAGGFDAQHMTQFVVHLDRVAT